MGGLSASAAFREHLRRLCLGEFPCGAGSWNRSRFELRKRKPEGNAAQREADAGTAQHQETGTPSEESLETLMEFVSSQDSPWALSPDCSPEDQHLRELAVQSPQLIRDNFIFLFFRSLRIVDKGVNEVDENLLKFQNLEELILSANQISKINSAHLPRTLKVLELCGNEIVGLQDLCSHPPPELQHLGLGYNRLLGSSEDKYLTAEFWPNLLSLDLSFNNFTDLLGIVSKLATLWRLRTLVLLGNPLVLIPGYRGFVIDSLPKLCILDDRNISPDEKHQFHGLSSKPDLIVNKAQLVVSVGKIKGVPNPIKPEELESGPESPVITHSYYVTYEFVEREKAEDTNNAEVIKFHQSQMVATPNPGSPPESVDTGGLESPAISSLLQQEPPANRANRHLTPRKPWSETIECSHRREHVTGDLVALKAFLMTGTTVTVVEEKVLSWPIAAAVAEDAGKKGKAEKGKAEKEKPKDGGQQAEKEKGKPHRTPQRPASFEKPGVWACESGEPLNRMVRRAKTRTKKQKLGEKVLQARKPQWLPKEKEKTKNLLKGRKSKKSSLCL
ncbi:leucine-rich repeat-containing protein 43 isoform X6 [Trachemys scripta elegans]|uniref:leucine-rich repeat-containing protein 43 isoform X6 n=1 Tax=Trachemys scripta elegans TaxID=31138 RepID=UPI001555533C|nr:leucine-rich repeat-containing protein 43 isoform X6 [Trachemys scripta elegans]